MKYISILVYGSLFLSIMSCGSSGSQTNTEATPGTNNETPAVMPTAEGLSIIFYKLDDFAKIYAGDSLILDTSEKYGMNPDHDVLVSLGDVLLNGRQLFVEVHNAGCTDCNSNKWQIIYEIFKDGESVDYVSEDSNGQPADLGLMTTLEHELESL